MKLNIREARGDEIDLVRSLFAEYASEITVDLSFQGFDEELATLPGAYTPPTGRLLLALDGDDAVGCVALRPLGDNLCEMKRLYVRSSARGTGLGRRLVAAIIEEARRIGYSRMRLDTLPSMAVAISLYQGAGFVEIEAYRHNPVEGARFMELVLR